MEGISRKIEDVKYEISLNRKHLEIRRRVAIAEFDKEAEMLDRYEKWTEQIEKETKKNV